MRSNSLTLISLIAALLLAPLVRAEEGGHTAAANFSLYSQYLFRGLTQTNQRPAIQGGVDYAHAGGGYAGVWLSNVSWFSDTNAGSSNSLELDLYAGFRKSWGNGLSADLGLMRYQYPGAYPALPAGTVKPHTDEAYVLIGWKWATLKYSCALGDLFGVEDSRGSDYLDFTVSVPLNKQWSVAAHAGRQRFTGVSTAAQLSGTTNDALYTYEDYRAALTYAFVPGWSASLALTHTTAPAAGYTVLGKNLGDNQLAAGVTRGF